MRRSAAFGDGGGDAAGSAAFGDGGGDAAGSAGAVATAPEEEKFEDCEQKFVFRIDQILDIRDQRLDFSSDLTLRLDQKLGLEQRLDQRFDQSLELRLD